jgi:hypothetical protein
VMARKHAPEARAPIANPSREPAPIRGATPTHVLIDRSLLIT